MCEKAKNSFIILRGKEDFHILLTANQHFTDDIA